MRMTQLDFGVTMAVKFKFGFETFSIGNGQPSTTCEILMNFRIHLIISIHYLQLVDSN
jgi:hypothetical protein